MVILSANPYEIPKEEIGKLKAEKLILAGQDYRSARRPVLKAIADGIANGSKAY